MSRSTPYSKRKRLSLGILLPIAAIVASLSFPGGVLGVEVTINQVTAVPGDSVVVPINLQLEIGETLLGYDFWLDFDPAILDYSASSVGDLNPTWTLVANPDPTLGSPPPDLGITCFNTDQLVGPTSGNIAEITLDVSATAPTGFYPVSFYPGGAPYLNRLDEGALGTFPDDFINGGVLIVPEPTSGILLAVGALSALTWALFRSRRRE